MAGEGEGKKGEGVREEMGSIMRERVGRERGDGGERGRREREKCSGMVLFLNVVTVSCLFS